MELLYVDNITKEFQYENEYFFSVINYIIGKKVHLHSNFGMYVNRILYANNLTQIENIDYHENYFVLEKRETEVELKSNLNKSQVFL